MSLTEILYKRALDNFYILMLVSIILFITFCAYVYKTYYPIIIGKTKKNVTFVEQPIIKIKKSKKAKNKLLNLINQTQTKYNSYIIIITDNFWSKQNLPHVKNLIGTHIVPMYDETGLMKILNNLNDSVKNIDLIVHSDGGYSASANMMTEILLNCGKNINVHVPYKAISAGAQIAVCGSTLYFSKYSFITPIDTLIDFQSGCASCSCNALINLDDSKIKETRYLLLKNEAIKEYGYTEYLLDKKFKKPSMLNDNMKILLLNNKFTHSFLIDYKILKDIDYPNVYNDIKIEYMCIIDMLLSYNKNPSDND